VGESVRAGPRPYEVVGRVNRHVSITWPVVPSESLISIHFAPFDQYGAALWLACFFASSRLSVWIDIGAPRLCSPEPDSDVVHSKVTVYLVVMLWPFRAIGVDPCRFSTLEALPWA
jgi:hypothetical protein